MTQHVDARADLEILKNCGVSPEYRLEYLLAMRKTYTYAALCLSFALHDLVDAIIHEVKKQFGGAK